MGQDTLSFLILLHPGVRAKAYESVEVSLCECKPPKVLVVSKAFTMMAIVVAYIIKRKHRLYKFFNRNNILNKSFILDYNL